MPLTLSKMGMWPPRKFIQLERWVTAVPGDTVCQGSAHEHHCPPGSPIHVLVQRRCRLCRGARVGMAAAVPEPFVTAGLRFPLALQQRHRDACSRSPHNMFALISQLPPDSPRCRAPRRRGGRCAPAEPRREGEPGWEPARMEGAGDCGQTGCHKGRRGWKHHWHGQRMHQRPPVPEHTHPGCATSPGDSGQGDRPGCDPCVSPQPTLHHTEQKHMG